LKKSYTYILVLSIVLLSVIAYIYIHNNYSNAKSISVSTQDSIAKPKDEAVRDTNSIRLFLRIQAQKTMDPTL